MALTAAVDTGGTFTDIVWLDGGVLRCRKVPSTPHLPHLSTLQGIKDVNPKRLLVGTTVTTNALIEMKEEPPALITTLGFEDVLEIGRQTRLNIYDLKARKAPCPIPPHLRFGVSERIRADGTISIPLDRKALLRIAKHLVRRKNPRVCVCFLHSTTNPDHEKTAARILKNQNLIPRTSHTIVPIPREYERFLTCVLSAYAEPSLERFLYGLREGFDGEIFVMSNFGGYIGTERAVERAVETVMSGPVGGASAAALLAKRLNLGPVVSLDMGGTSCDVCAISGGLTIERRLTIGCWTLPVRSVSVATIGAGGGSVVWVDAGGALRVGPHSAGADPGPASYGKGGPPTLTDANLLLRRLPQTLPSGLQLNINSAREAFKRLASLLGISVEDVAYGALRVADATMAEAVRGVTVRHGLDPRRFTLVAFGGAGPLHAANIAQILSMNRVVIPPEPGVFSAYGLLAAKYVREEAIPVMAKLNRSSMPSLMKTAETIRTRLGKRRVRLIVEMRYVGQEHEISVDYKDELDILRRRFETVHKKLYGWIMEGGDIEFVSLVGRVAFGRRINSRFEPFNKEINGALTRADVLRRKSVAGPVVICDLSATVYVPEGWVAKAGQDGVLFLERGS